MVFIIPKKAEFLGWVILIRYDMYNIINIYMPFIYNENVTVKMCKSNINMSKIRMGFCVTTLEAVHILSQTFLGSLTPLCCYVILSTARPAIEFLQKMCTKHSMSFWSSVESQLLVALWSSSFGLPIGAPNQN